MPLPSNDDAARQIIERLGFTEPLSSEFETVAVWRAALEMIDATGPELWSFITSASVTPDEARELDPFVMDPETPPLEKLRYMAGLVIVTTVTKILDGTHPG